MERKFDKYKDNLSVVEFDGAYYIQSYTTKVAKIDYDNRNAEILGYWSMTTSKHINYACNELGLTITKKQHT
jgi:hypothetical protein